MKINNIISIVALASVIFGSFGCSEELTRTPLDKTSAELKDASFNSLSFSWNKVKGAVQYSYQLSETESEEAVATGVTKGTSASFTDLKPSTDYTLTVLAYAPYDSDFTTSEPVVLSARTSDLVAVGKPVLEIDRDVNTVYVMWDWVDNADSYQWWLYDAGGNLQDSGETADYYVQFDDMQSGSYNFKVVAKTSVPGYKDGDVADFDFNFVRERVEVWRMAGTYASSILGTDWTADLVAYDDDTYTIEAWYGIDGFDFTFSLGEQNALVCESPVATGLEAPSELTIDVSGSSMTGNQDSGSVTISVSDGANSGEDTFSWQSSPVDPFCGKWVMHYTAHDDGWGDDYDYVMDVTITRIDDNTVLIPMPVFTSDSAEMKIDVESMTYTIRPTTVTYDYVFAGAEGDTSSVTGSISPDGFTVTGWTFYYGGVAYYSNTYLEFYRAEEAE